MGLACALSVMLEATAASANAAPWTLESAAEFALQRAPRMRSALAMREIAQAYRSFGRVPRVGNPEVSVRAMIGKPDDPAATYALLFGLPFDVAGRRKAWRAEARFVVDEAEALLASARNDVRSDARAACAQVAAAEAAEAVADQSAGTARELLRGIAARVAARTATALDLALAEAQYAEAESDLARARRGVVAAENEFRRALGLAAQIRVDVAPLARPGMPDGLSSEAAVALALGRRHEPVAWASRRERWRSADARLRAEAVAPLTAAVEAERQGNRQPNSTVGASVRFELPLAWRNQGERAVAREESSAAELERELVESAITREVVTAYARLESALVELTALEERALPAAERMLSMVSVMLDSGAIDYFRVLSARRDAFALRERRVDALRDAWLSRIELEHALGGTEHWK